MVRASGALEDCDIYGNALAGIEIKDNASPEIRQCKIHDGKQGGAYIHTNGRGVLENCDLYGNGLASVSIKQGGNPTLRGCKIHDGARAAG
jgi:hypothetical protein